MRRVKLYRVLCKKTILRFRMQCASSGGYNDIGDKTGQDSVPFLYKKDNNYFYKFLTKFVTKYKIYVIIYT